MSAVRRVGVGAESNGMTRSHDRRQAAEERLRQPEPALVPSDLSLPPSVASPIEQAAQHAERAARSAGDLLLSHFERVEAVTFKGVGDIVTEADLAAERLLREALARAYPHIPFFGEERGFDGDEEPEPWALCWVVDPLDGTTNFAAGLPFFAVSIALVRAGAPVAGVIYDPVRDEMYRAVRGGGSRRNDKPCHVSGRDPFDPVSAVGVSADVIRERMLFVTRLHKTRSLGAASLHMAYTACGIFEAALDPYTRLWDVAAGALVVEEAGGQATHWDGRPLFPLGADGGGFQGAPVDYLVSNGVRHDELVAGARRVRLERLAPA
jgi:myo-inositol-1(or 4)-monophosphatase